MHNTPDIRIKRPVMVISYTLTPRPPRRCTIPSRSEVSTRRRRPDRLEPNLFPSIFLDIHLCDHDRQHPRLFFPLRLRWTDSQQLNWLGYSKGVQHQSPCTLPELISSKGPSAFWLAGEKTDDPAISTGVMVFSTSSTVLGSIKVGDLVSLSAKVSEFRSTSRPNDLHLTELASPSNITVLSSGNPIVPIVLGRDRSPPTQYFSSLDSGRDGFLSVPANQSLQDTPGHQLQPDNYGLDFWESLEGQVVTIPSPTSLGFGNSFREFWVRGNWHATGINGRGGLTITFGTRVFVFPPSNSSLWFLYYC